MTTAAQSAARDAAAIAAGIPSFELMRRAGNRAALSLLARYPAQARQGVVVVTGPGNNGGDGFIMAAALLQEGVPVHVVGEDPRTPDAVAARAALPRSRPSPSSTPGVVIDALLGTGASGPLRSPIAGWVDYLRSARSQGATVVSLDLPSGLDATSGQADPATVPADLTLSFGTWKRGQLLRRDLCGQLACIDIGLDEHARLDDGAPEAVGHADVVAWLPTIDARAWKGTRKRLAIVGGAEGMAGAVSLAAGGAYASGVGMVRCFVAPASIGPIQALAPGATAHSWDMFEELGPSWADVLVVGPGFGLQAAAARVSDLLAAWAGPVVLDADALSAFAGRTDDLRALLAGRAAILTPHAGEAARLLGVPAGTVVADPFAAVTDLATRVGCIVLLKGVPTAVASPRGAVLVSPRGTPALAVAGSGDLLSGIAGTLLAQIDQPQQAAAAAAWIHGRAAELAQGDGPVRGTRLTDVLEAVPQVFREGHAARLDGELEVLPRAGDRPP